MNGVMVGTLRHFLMEEIMKKTILLGITGGIAAYKSADLTSQLVKRGYNVEVIMTKNACQFIQPLTFSSLTKNIVYTDTFERIIDGEVKHIELAKKADLFVIVPATANIIAKIAHGISDDMLTSTFLAATCKKLICPAMNTHMYENPITQDNIKLCQHYGMEFVEPAVGHLACGDEGKGKLASVDTILEAIEQALIVEKPLFNKKVLVTAGPTQESLDPVRYLTNHSSGKMGYEIAKTARDLGADVTLMSGPVDLPKPFGIKMLYFTTANDLYALIKEILPHYDYIIKAAAIGDYRAKDIAMHKIKKQEDTLNITLIKNPDILKYIGEHKREHQIVCGFAMETQNLLENATQKLKSKNCDLLVANNLTVEGAGFKNDTNVATIITKDTYRDYELMSKKELAKVILETMMKIEKER